LIQDGHIREEPCGGPAVPLKDDHFQQSIGGLHLTEDLVTAWAGT
jgi:hypothetical protein